MTERASENADRFDLDPTIIRDVFRLPIELNKDEQREQLFRRWSGNGSTVTPRSVMAVVGRREAYRLARAGGCRAPARPFGTTY